MKGQIKDSFDERFGERFGESLSRRFGESLEEKTKYAKKMLQSIAASES